MTKGPLFIQYCAKDFLDGVRFLTPWEELVYRRVCDLIYASGDRVPDDDRKLAIMTKAGRRWPRIKKTLIDDGKLLLTDDGRISNARCQKEIAKILRICGQKMVDLLSKSCIFASDKPLKSHEPPSAPRARDTRGRNLNLKGETKEEESKPETSESVAAREGDSKSESGLEVAALPSELPPDPPTPDEIVEVEVLVEQAITTLKGGVSKGIRDPVAYRAAITDAKFTSLVKKLNAWVGTALDGEAQWAAWEVLAAAQEAGTRSGMDRTMRRNFNKLDKLYRATEPIADDMELAA